MSLAEFIKNGGREVPNPEYNPKTKKGRVAPPTLISTTPIESNPSKINTLANNIRTGFTQYGDETKYSDYGVTINPVNTEKELNLERAKNQSEFEQYMNFMVQAGVGEVVLGTLEGFGNIADGIINFVTRDQYGVNPYTQFMSEAKEKLKNNFQIYRENPDATWQMGDFAWWMDNAVSVATTASLMLPAAGWARGISYAGKLSGASRALNSATRWASRGIAGVNKAGKIGNKFGTLRSLSNKANRIERTINEGSSIVGTALLSRTGENYMEAKGVFDDVYENSLENLNNMPDEEYNKFLQYNPEFINKSKEEIAREIARNSANTTFVNDYAMLLMDIPQFKALGKLWGGASRRASTASERIAAENAKRTLAGKTSEELIKNNIWNKTKEGIRYALKNPKQSLFAMELGEGFEEIYQGIQTEKGMEVAEKYFNPNMTSRSLSSYLTDGSIWEQGFWGSIGGIAFNKVGKGIQAADKAIRGAWNKKHMTADEYEKWKRSNSEISIEQFNNITSQVDEYLNNMRAIQEGTNPFNIAIDPETGQEIIKNGEIVNETIDEEQKSLLRDKAVSKFVDDVTMTSIDNGTFNLMKEVLGSSEFDKYIADNGLQLDGIDKSLSQEVINRMDEVANIYENAIKDVNALADTTNPFITIAAARNITRNKLKLQEYDDIIANINQRIAEANDTNTNYNDYIERERYNIYKNNVDNLLRQKKRLSLNKAKGELSESAYRAKVKEIDKIINVWNDWAEANTTKGALQAVRKEFSEALGQENSNLEKAFNDFIIEYEKLTNRQGNINTPIETIENLINQELINETRRNYTISQIPTNQEEYEDMYNEFSRSMDAMELARRDEYLERIKNYLATVDDIDDAVQKILNENTGNERVDEALHYLRYLGDDFTDIQLGGKGQFTTNMTMDDIIETERKKRDNAIIANTEAENEGVGTPPAPSQELTQSNDVPSTGSQAQSETTSTTNTKSTVNNNQPTIPSQPTQSQSQPTSTVSPTNTFVPDERNPDLGGGDDGLPNPMKVDTSTDVIDDSDNTPSLRGEIKARQYIMQIGFKNEARLNEITESLAKEDNSKRDALLNEVVDYLTKQGFEINLARNVTWTAFVSTVNLFGAMNQKSAFGKLAQQLAIGFSKKAAQKMSTTELLDGKALDETVDEFLTEYSKLVNNDNLNGEKTVINIESLFNYLLTDENVDTRTAMYIYNNLSQYIAKHDGSKYIFTGFNTANKLMLSAVEFINQLKENKAQLKDTFNRLHISPIERRQLKDKKEAEDYREALIAAHNGTANKIYIEPQYTNVKEIQPNGYEEHKKVMSNLNVIVEYKKGNKIKSVKIGILRTVKMDSDGNTILPIRHQSGFANKLYNKDNSIEFDCDKLFHAIIYRNDKYGKELWKDIAEYYLNTRIIIDKRRSGAIDFKTAQKELAEAMSKEAANRIMSNPYIREILINESYKFDIGVKDDDISKARDISSKIASILFFGREDDVNDPTNYEYNSFAADTKTLSERYATWKLVVKANYEQTYKFQEAIESGDSTPIINKINISYNTIPNILPPNTPLNDIKDLDFELDPTADNYNPLVYVKNGRLIGEDGKDYGEADPIIGDYSMGFITYKDNNITHVAYFKKYNELKDSELAKQAKNEVYRLIKEQLNNVYDSTNIGKHEDTFKRIGTLLTELCGYQGLLRLGNHFSEGDISVRITSDGQTINILHHDRYTNKKKPILAFFSYDSKGNPGHAIRIFGKNYDATTNNKEYIDINNINGNQNVSKETVNAWIEYALNDMFNTVKLNRSALGFNKQTVSKGVPSIFTWNKNNNEFILHLNGQELKYKNYADFITQNNGFQVNVYKNEDGSFVTRYMNENRITINTAIRDESNVPKIENHAVTDALYTNNANSKRKTINTNQLLKLAGVDDKVIDTLVQDIDNTSLVTRRITISPEKGDAFMYYDTKDKTVHITPKGAMAMNGNPSNAIRLILHENIHRHFNSSKFTNNERQRIVSELQTVYDFVRAKLVELKNTDASSKEWAENVERILDKTQTYSDQQTCMEEFLVECLTQGSLTEWLNNTEYGADADISNINKSKKSILQKIIDIILDLLGVKNRSIKNNSILAREYVILSKGTTPTTIAGSTAPTVSSTPVRKSPPVEGTSTSKPASDSKVNTKVLNETKAKIDIIRSDFEARIKRSPDFEENHTYLLDGEPIDYSVTQKIHGKQDVGKWGVPASTLGNTADAAARGYFDNHSVVTDDMEIPNVSKNQREELIADMSKIEAHLDAKFGKNKYKVITQEFPIGGTIIVNGEVKTIAGTMDMIVYTDTGDIYIYDFKTKRIGNSDGNISPETLHGYKQQVNIYRQIIEENYPELKGKVHTGSLIKFNVDYPEPNDTIKYRISSNNKSQLQISKDGGKTYENIQDALIDYTAPSLADDYENPNVIIPIEQQDYGDTIGALPEVKLKEPAPNDNINKPTKEVKPEDVGLDDDGFIKDDDDYDFDFSDTSRFATTEQLDSNVNSSTEIYAPAIANGATDNAYGVKTVNSMSDFVGQFPNQYQADIQLILDSSELNYTCQ